MQTDDPLRTFSKPLASLRSQIWYNARAGNNKEHLVVVWIHTDAIGKVAAMVIAGIERKPERLCVGDESQHLSNVVQNGLRTLRHRKDLRTKLAHPFIRVLGGPN